MINEMLLNEAEKCAHVTLNFGFSIDRCDFNTGTVVIINESTKERRTIENIDLLIGADGAYSKVRGQMLRNTRINFQQTYIDHGYVELCLPALNGEFQMDGSHLHIWVFVL